jgi:hypothetical protein
MATVRSEGPIGPWEQIVKKAFVGNQRIKAGRPRVIISADVPDCPAKVGTLCWDKTHKDAYICTVASGTWVEINA